MFSPGIELPALRVAACRAVREIDATAEIIAVVAASDHPINVEAPFVPGAVQAPFALIDMQSIVLIKVGPGVGVTAIKAKCQILGDAVVNAHRNPAGVEVVT